MGGPRWILSNTNSVGSKGAKSKGLCMPTINLRDGTETIHSKS